MAGADDFDSKSDPNEAKAATSSAADGTQLDFDVAFFDSILKQSPDFVDVLRCQGELLTRKGCHDRALVIDRRLATLLPNDCVVRYNLACSLALSGERSEAVETLNQAIEQGYDDIEYLVADHDLDSIREEPGFVALVKKYGGARKKKPRRKK